MPLTPKQQAREDIDRQLTECGWMVQDAKDMNIMAGPGVAVREFVLKKDHGRADYRGFSPSARSVASHRVLGGALGDSGIPAIRESEFGDGLAHDMGMESTRGRVLLALVGDAASDPTIAESPRVPPSV